MKKSLAQPGMALLMVLILLAVLSTLAIEMTERLQQHIRRAETQKLSQQAYWYAIAAESLAISQLARSLMNKNELSLSQDWATSAGDYPLREASINFKIRDLQTCFNLNAFTDPFSQGKEKNRLQLIALFKMINIPSDEALKMANNIVEFIKPKIRHSDSGVKNPAASKPATSGSVPFLIDQIELRLIKGMTAKNYHLLKTVTCVLPIWDQKLNLNTLPSEQAPVLAALLTPHLSLHQARQLILSRPEKGWHDLNKVLNLPQLARLPRQIRDNLTLSSNYFMLNAEIHIGRISLALKSLLVRQDSSSFYVLRHQTGELE